MSSKDRYASSTTPIVDVLNRYFNDPAFAREFDEKREKDRRAAFDAWSRTFDEGKIV